MTKPFLLSAVVIALFVTMVCTQVVVAQNADSLGETKPHGNMWGLAFGDYAYKSKADTVGPSGSAQGRGQNQYSKYPASSRFFQFRRIYLGYNYTFSDKLSAEVLFAAESDYTQGSIGNQSANGDVLQDGKFAPFIKQANVRWKNMFKGTDLVMGEMLTPAFPMLTEVTWGYRSVERTAADMRKTNSYDEGISLQGAYGKNKNFGYNLMVGNGNGAVPATNNFQMFYGDVWAKLFNQRLVLDFYQDYEKIAWTPVDTLANRLHHDRNMSKFFIAYTAPKITVGIEAFSTTLMGDVQATSITNRTYYYTTVATTVSYYVRGRVYKDKLGFLARYDNYNPGHKISEVTNNPKVISYTAITSSFDPTTREQLFILGLDYTPFPNLHIIPNFYMNTYQCTLPKKDYNLNTYASGTFGQDVLYRLTIYFIFGKKDPVRF